MTRLLFKPLDLIVHIIIAVDLSSQSTLRFQLSGKEDILWADETKNIKSPYGSSSTSG